MNIFGHSRMGMARYFAIAILTMLVCSVASAATFTNPFYPQEPTPDQAIIYKDGYYHMTHTHHVGGARNIVVVKSRSMDFSNAVKRVVWTPPPGTHYSAHLWAPQLQFIENRWVIYFAASGGDMGQQRMFAIRSTASGPNIDAHGQYEFVGQVTDPSNKWAIDGRSEVINGQRYFFWSGWEGDTNVRQILYIAPMSNPYTISGPRVEIARPDRGWEQIGYPHVLEGPKPIQRGNRLFLVYSASGSWTPDYKLGMLELNLNENPLDPSRWYKHPNPVFERNDAAGVFGPGHHGFFKSPDGTEDWFAYHATSNPNDGWNNRYSRAQKITWNPDGTPNFGRPIATGVPIALPSGERRNAAAQIDAASYNGMLGIQTEPTTDVGGGYNVGWIEDGDWLLFRNVDFGTGARTVEARVASLNQGGTIEFRLGSPSGQIIATLHPTHTGGWQNWVTESSNASGSGVHDLYLVFRGSGTGLFNINWFKFNLGPAPSAIMRMESFNFPGQYIRHAYARGRIDANVNPFADSQWRQVPGLANPHHISFESVNFPGSYLRHRNGEVWLDTNDGSGLFAQDATWIKRPGRANGNYTSYESFNFPGNFIRHRGAQLFSEQLNNALDRSDGTFIER